MSSSLAMLEFWLAWPCRGLIQGATAIVSSWE